MESPDQREKEISDILDKCYAEVVEDAGRRANVTALGLQSLLKMVLYRHLLNSRREWGSAQLCSYPGCVRATTASSHTVQRAGSLRLIAENGHVLTPSFNASSGTVELQRVGVNKASTFTGFCDAHEQIFTFERQKKPPVTDDDHELQVFRTVCRELRTLQHHINSFEDLLRLYKRRHTTEMILRMMNKLGEAFFQKYGIRKVSFRFNIEDYVTDVVREQMSHSRRIYKRILRVFYQAFREGPDHRLHASGLASFLLTLPVLLPVALAGRSGFSALEGGIRRDVDVILNVTPYAGETLCFMTCTEENGDLVERLCKEHDTNIERVSLVESWMLYCSDHWFLKPSAWLVLPSPRQRLLCQIINGSESHIWEECHTSIFDEARKQLLDEMQIAVSSVGHKAATISLIEKEKAKLK